MRLWSTVQAGSQTGAAGCFPTSKVGRATRNVCAARVGRASGVRFFPALVFTVEVLITLVDTVIIVLSAIS